MSNLCSTSTVHGHLQRLEKNGYITCSNDCPRSIRVIKENNKERLFGDKLRALRENGGKIQIVSARGYWEENCDKIITHKYEHPFDGTIVNIEVNVDNKLYLTRDEKENSEIYEEIDNIF